MSQTITESHIPSKILVSQKSSFPTDWLSAADDKYVIDRASWNTEPAPEHLKIYAHYSVEWNGFFGHYLLKCNTHGVAVGALILRLCCGIEKCIIPVGCMPDYEDVFFAFTLAGPCDAAGKKDFYVLFYGGSPEETWLCGFDSGFSSVADFHDHSHQRRLIAPVPGGCEALLARYKEMEMGTRNKWKSGEGLEDWASVLNY